MLMKMQIKWRDNAKCIQLIQDQEAAEVTFAMAILRK